MYILIFCHKCYIYTIKFINYKVIIHIGDIMEFIGDPIIDKMKKDKRKNFGKKVKNFTKGVAKKFEEYQEFREEQINKKFEREKRDLMRLKQQSKIEAQRLKLDKIKRKRMSLQDNNFGNFGF